MLQRLMSLRPFAYHTCSALNFQSIRRTRSLKSAADLLAGTGYSSLLTVRRKSSVVVELSSGPVEVRDNLPLRIGSLALEEGCSLEQFLLLLNRRVYLWPGNNHGPCRPGPEHFQHYQGSGAVHILRVPLASLLSANPGRELEVTFCNSGTARHHGGQPVQRGPNTFVAASLASGRPSEVKELCFVGSLALPPDTEWSTVLAGPWQPLCEA